jgi:peptide/nickel transport system permease protein
MRFCDMMIAFPALVLAVTALALFPPSMATVSLVIALHAWTWFARTIRGTVLRVKELDFVQSARSLGAGNYRIISRHVLPNVAPIIIVTATTLLGFAILTEAALSFFGLSGTTMSWGWDISQGRNFLGQAWWMASFPGLSILVTVMALNAFGDWLRDELDPSLRS